ncbi:PNGase F N-terminal domain-containing protein [Mangrovibacterium diazotrophicum]|uniref:Peptide-N-glycosidase F-like protein n=1 Tax=Mangrovibacterium diazotrophicum TaxID=1261403 RepID=A0A419W768_9BACT|nr:PNGase F N-terminal domain-containing protein [Mangrovibacterium diazotrophicum]RKD91295.1 peptide-N-glycosidase F-like protein [Mangrovibacterium diazotrophicum]
MYRKGILLLLIGVCTLGYAMGITVDKSGRIEYSAWRNGEVDSNSDKLIVEYTDSIAKSWVDQSGKNLIPEVPQQVNYLAYPDSVIIRQATFMDGQSYFTTNRFRSLKGFEPEGDPVKILGYKCQKYVGTSFSNKIELWVTTKTGLQATPMLYFPFPGAVVMRYVRNGNSGWEATNIDFYRKKKVPEMIPADMGIGVDDVEFSRRLADAFVKEVPVFKKQQINWGGKIENPEGEYTDSLYRFAGGTVVLKRVKLPQVPDGTSIFAEVTEQSNGDAYDRTGSVFVVPVDKTQSFLDGLKYGVDSLPKYTSKEGKVYQGVVETNDFDPLIELMRFFTPFGVHHFNDKRDVGIAWADSVTYKEDVSDFLPVLQNECWIGVFVGNYDGGGHKVSLNLKYYLNEQEVSEKPAKKYWVQPVFNTTNVMEMAGQEYGTMFASDTLTVDFEVPAGVKNVTFRYITTGHGGWGGGDEFVPKKNELFIDNQPFFSFTPWRVDCGTYRASNPASGNFWNGLSSSDYSRSGWCPGTVSHPYFTPVDNLTPGKHSIKVYIPLGEREGNMFSAWNVSGVFIGEIEE